METGNTLYAGSMETGQARENLSASLSLGRRRSRGLSYLLPAPCSPLQPRPEVQKVADVVGSVSLST